MPEFLSFLSCRKYFESRVANSQNSDKIKIEFSYDMVRL
jgi:hypothetical protein